VQFPLKPLATRLRKSPGDRPFAFMYGRWRMLSGHRPGIASASSTVKNTNCSNGADTRTAAAEDSNRLPINLRING
jgi:hypothetical protein